MPDDDTSPNPSPNLQPVSPTSPEPVVLATDACIGLLRTSKITADTITTVRNAVAEDLRFVHTRITDVSDAASGRFERAEQRLAILEGKFESLKVASPQVLVATDSQLTLTPTITNSGIPQTNDPLATPLASTIRRSHVPPPLNLSTENPDNTVTVEEPSTPRPTSLNLSEPPGAPIRPSTTRKSESFYVNVMSMKMPLNIPTFSGASHENFSTFIRSFMDHANAAKSQLTPESKLSVFLTYLTDFARDKAQELMDTKQEASFDDVVAYLKSTFQDPTRAETERQQLRQCTQRPDESVDAFSTRVRKLAQSAYVDKSRDYIADKAKEAFLDGLAFNLKFHVKGESSSTFQEAQNSAIKFELLLAEAAKANTIAPQGLAVVPAPQEFPHQPDQPRFKTGTVCFRCGFEGHYKNQCWRFQNEHDQDNYQNHGPRPQYFDRTPQFPTNDPVQRYQIRGDQQQYNSRYINSLEPVQNPLVDQLRFELQANQAQMDALIKRNAELAAAATSAPASKRINVLAAVPRLGPLLTLFTLVTLISPSSAFTPLISFSGTFVKETVNCFMMPTSIRARYGSEAPHSAAGPMENCKFSSGACTTREGATFIWKPVETQQQRYIFFATMKGHKSDRIWLSENKEFFLSFDGKSHKVIDGNKKLLLTDQGCAVMVPPRDKRHAEPEEEAANINMTSFVTSNQPPAQLTANRFAVLEKSGTRFWHDFMALCASSNRLASATLAAAASNPPIAARKLTGKENIQAKFIKGQYTDVWEAMRGSPYVTSRRFSVHEDPSTGSITVANLEKAVSVWEKFKSFAETVFSVCSIVCDLIVMVIVGIVLIFGVAKFYIGPWLVLVRAKSENPVPTTSEGLNRSYQPEE
ncbi:hypothetical protein CAEBREN_07759 [Caenorhabditis brenneri]|uniref:CCHC-type domain-containing protein n=1 Tax=Caenorhabditis brenneri TaxID=135651 RepID=G0MQQ1_CAEBE|nr:hypothetical protein CAEBREN_07759 [Caenorhabditis brenneri]